MRVLFWLLAVFAAAVALVILGRVGAGYVMFVYPPYRVELSLPFFVVASLAGFLLLYAAMRLLGHAVSLPTYVRAYRFRRRRERAHAALAAALQAYYEGRYARAEKEAAAAFEAGPTPGVAALLAARAAHQMRDFARRDRWLERAEAAGEAQRAALLVTRAELALEERDYRGARDALRSLHASGPKHIATQRMLLRAERGAGAWSAASAGSPAATATPSCSRRSAGCARKPSSGARRAASSMPACPSTRAATRTSSSRASTSSSASTPKPRSITGARPSWPE